MLQQQVQSAGDAHHSVIRAVFPVVSGANKLCQAKSQCTRNEQHESITSDCVPPQQAASQCTRNEQHESITSERIPPQLVESMSPVEPSMIAVEGNSQIEELVNVEPAQIDEPGNVQGQYGESLLGDGSPVEKGAVEQPQQMTLLLSAVTKHEFNAKEPDWGFASFLPHSVLHDPERGYLVNDACLVEAYVSTGETQGLISHEFILENDSDKHETKGDDGVKAAIDNQTTMKTEAAIEPEDPTDEDMNTFFSSLESELLSSKIIVSREEAEEAVAKLEDVMNMTPVDFYNSSRFSTLKQPFKILASFNCSSTTLTIEQKNKLLAMEESMKELADRAAKAVEDMNHLSEKQSMKLTITHSLDSNVVRYKEMESEVKRVEQKLAAFHEQVEEAQKEMESMLAERKGIFRSSKRMKVELEALEKKWAEYEAKAEVAETEEKTVEAEWERMKDFISSIKGKI
ncbi:hypothetical protein V6N13_038067 [Hibiscus sabdariffa]